MSKFNRVYDGVLRIISNEREDIRAQAKEDFINAFELDERMIILRDLQKNNPLVADIIEIAIKELVGNEFNNIKLPSSWIDYPEKEIIRGRLELLRKDWGKYTLEELVSLVK